MSASDTTSFWDHAVMSRGHTGYSDPLLLRYDQPIRLATIGGVIDQLYPSGLAGKSALDIGCGVGDFVALLRDRGATVAGVDISSEVIAKAKQRFAGDASVTLQVGRLPDVPFAPGRMDLITSVTVLQHVIDDDEFVEALRTLGSTLRFGGHMVLLELTPPARRSVRIESEAVTYLAERPPDEWLAAFEKAGLRLVARPVFPQVGIALLQGLAWILHRTQSGRASLSAGALESRESANDPDGEFHSAGLGRDRRPLHRRFLRWALHFTQRAILWIAIPFDRVLRLPFPPARFRRYQVFVVMRNDQHTQIQP
jgi:SAM-dependent methyltransferase